MDGCWVVAGATSWGLTLAWVMARAGTSVKVLVRSEDEASLLREYRTIPARAPFVSLPIDVQVSADPAILRSAAGILAAVPAQRLRGYLRDLAGMLPPRPLLVSACKGIELGSGLRMSEVIAGELAPLEPCVAVLSGPNLAAEIARDLPAATVVASNHAATAEEAAAAFAGPRFRVYTHDDVVGVEYGGALKNIVALAAGISDGLGYGDNAKAGLITRGLVEISRLGMAEGARELTFSGLSGLGDLLATCASPLSRNRTVGLALAAGRSLDDVLKELGHVAEGVPTTDAVRGKALSLGVEMPIVEELWRVLFEGRPPQAAAESLLVRRPRAELQR